jgi:hypothetical protein
MFKFKPTVLTFIILVGLCGLFMYFIPHYWWALPCAFLTVAIGSYQLGKINTTRESELSQYYQKILAEAIQVEEIATSSNIALFPDIQMELVELAVAKYLSIGLQKEADDLRTQMVGLGGLYNGRQSNFN